MPIFRFVLTHPDMSPEETFTSEFSDLNEAWEEATATAGELLADYDGSLQPSTEFRVQIQDEVGRPLRTIRIITDCHE